MNERDDSNRPTEMAYFFIPLPETLRLPEGYVFRVFRPLGLRDLREHDARGSHEPPEPKLTCSLCVHHVPLNVPLAIKVALDVSMEAAARSLPFIERNVPDRPASTDVADSEAFVCTVLEAAVVIDLEGSEDEDRVLNEGFDDAVSAVRSLQSLYYVGTKHPLTLVARENLPPCVPMALRRVKTGEPECDNWSDTIVPFFINDSFARYVRDSELTKEELEVFQSAAEALVPSRVFSGYADLWREARVALRRRGDYRGAIVAAETAAQLLLDDLLLHLLWEEGVAPEEAAENYFSNQGLKKRVRSYYHYRLRGKWSLKDGPLAAWASELSSVRNRVVHGGYEPSRDEAYSGVDALRGLEEFVCDRLSARSVIDQYPRTVMSFLGKAGLERRDRWSEWLGDLAEDPDEPDWTETFGRWRWVVQDALEEVLYADDDETDVISVLLLKGDGAREWWLHDRVRRRVRLSSEPRDWNEDHEGAIESTRERMREVGAPPPWTIGWMGDPGEPAEHSEWIREHRVLPFYGVMLRSPESP